MYVNTDLSSKTFPTVTKVVDYIKKADDPNPANRDFRPLASLLMRAVSATPKLRGHVLTRKTAVTSYEWTLTAFDKAQQEKADRAASRCRSAIQSLLEYHTDTPLFGVSGYGFSFGDPLPNIGRPAILEKRYAPFELYRLSPGKVATVDEDGNLVKEYDKATALSELLLFDVDDSHERGGLLRTIIFEVVLRQATVVEWNRLNARLKGVVTGTVDAEKLSRAVASLELPEGEVDKIIDSLRTALKTVGDNNYLMTYDAVNLNVSRIAEAGAGGSFASFLAYLDESIATAILGQSNTSSLPDGGGSRAALQVLHLIQADINFDDLNRVSRMVEDLLLLDYRENVDRNASSLPYSFEFVFDDIPDAERAARTFEALSRIPGGITVKRTEFYERLGLTPPAEGDETYQLGTDNIGRI